MKILYHDQIDKNNFILKINVDQDYLSQLLYIII